MILQGRQQEWGWIAYLSFRLMQRWMAIFEGGGIEWKDLGWVAMFGGEAKG